MGIPKLTLIISIFVVCGCVSYSSETPPLDSGTFTIIHLNDTYRVGAVEDGRRGGFGRVVTIVRDLQAAGVDVRITHAGDFLYPSLESQLWNGEQMVDALNFLNDLAPIYLVPGNHEFDRRTPNAVIEAIRASRFIWLADNLQLQTGKLDVDSALESMFMFSAAGRKIGIVSLTVLPDDGGNERDYAPVRGAYLEVAERTIEALELAGAELIIGLTHLNLADDIELTALKSRHPTFQFIVGGHEHDPQFRAGDASHAVLMKGASNARTIWQIDIDFAGVTPSLQTTEIAVDEGIGEDEAYQVLADKWRARLLSKAPFLPSRVGEATFPLDVREQTIRNEESAWGNFIVDQMPAAFGEPVADFAFVNSGTLRIDDFITDDITFEDIGRTFGFSSFLRHMTISGQDFITLMEAGFRGEGPGKGYFPQISGFRVCVDRSRPDGQRIVQLQVPMGDRWEDIDRTAIFDLVAPDYLYGGGDGYDFSKARDVSRAGSELKYLVLDAILVAQGLGRKVGIPIDSNNARIDLLDELNTVCF